MMNEPTAEGQKSSFESLDPVSQNREFHLFIADSLNKHLKVRNEAKLLSKTLSPDEAGEKERNFTEAVSVPLDLNLRHMLHYANIPQPMEDFIGLFCKLLVLHGEEADFKSIVWRGNRNEAGIFSKDPQEIKNLEQETLTMIGGLMLVIDGRKKTLLEKSLFAPESPIVDIFARWNREIR